jgi:hypothetical protein
MILRTVILTFFIALSCALQAQVHAVIGMLKEDVQELVKKEHREFSPDNSITKKQFNYLKYVNGKQTITWIIYFDEDDRCTATKKVCDYMEYDRVIKDLDNRCVATEKMEWECTLDDQVYTIGLTKEDWYFTVRERLKSL